MRDEKWNMKERIWHPTQSGLPPSYEECFCHKYAVISRSHTPPPPWSDSTLNGTNVNSGQSRRDILASQPELREYLSQLAKAQALQSNNNQTPNRQQRVMRESASAVSVPSQNIQVSARDQAVRSQRARTTISRWNYIFQQLKIIILFLALLESFLFLQRSQSESRARQQRIATMYEDGAFCMETTAIQSAFEHGVAFCSLM